MNPYTVLLLRPDYIADEFGKDTYMALADRIWGWGLYPKRWLGGHLALRRNLNVYEVEIITPRFCLTFIYWRKKP
jgi:hypothetical protein